MWPHNHVVLEWEKARLECTALHTHTLFVYFIQCSKHINTFLIRKKIGKTSRGREEATRKREAGAKPGSLACVCWGRGPSAHGWWAHRVCGEGQQQWGKGLERQESHQTKGADARLHLAARRGSPRSWS